MSITKIGVALLIVGLVVGVIAGYGVGFVVYKPRISDLESDVAEAQDSITSLQGQVNALNSSLLSTQAELAEAQAELMPGRVPILHVGDWWIMEIVFNETTYTLTQNVTGEGPDYYITYSEYDPPYQRRCNSTDWIDKSIPLVFPVRSEIHSEYTYDNTTITDTRNITFSVIYSGGVPFPLIVGKELNQTVIMNITGKSDTTMYTFESNMSIAFEVETIENVTVPAGTFTCFKINMRNATTGDLIFTTWYSDEAKILLKLVNYTTTPETITELKDYSV